jgi:hypothetical protein
MFGERGYLTFLTRALARKRPQGLIDWCCCCCLPKAAREEYGGVKVIHICPRTEGTFEEDRIGGEQSVPVQKMHQPSTEESRYSDDRRMEPSVVKRGHVSASEEWLCNKDSLQKREVDMRMLRKHPSLDIEKRCEDNGIDCKDAEIPVIRLHCVRDNYNEGRIIEICNQINMGLLTL